MKHYFENYKFLRTELKKLLYIAISVILFIEFVGFNYDELLPKFNVIANIILKLSYSYISALIFYYLVVHFKRQDEKRKFYAILNKKLTSIVLEHNRIYSQISKLNNNVQINYLDKENLKINLKNVNPHSIYDGIMYVNTGKVSWLKHLYIVAENTKTEIERIYLQSFLLEVELINLLDKINNNSLFQQVRLFNHTTISNEDFESFYESFYNYSLKIDNLQKYVDKEIKKYIKE